jgi:SAM-dependent methyltransferase
MKKLVQHLHLMHMKSQELWQPAQLLIKNGHFQVNESAIYGGSLHASTCQLNHYVPLFRRYITGRLLDVGCGRVPYYELLKDQTTAHFCIDHSAHSAGAAFLDQHIDLHAPWNLGQDFDAILCADVLAHLQNPALAIEQMIHHLAPHGVLIITTPFNYWMSHPPHEYYHPTRYALEHLMTTNGLKILESISYGGYADIWLDQLNKRWSSGNWYRLFKLFKRVFIKTPFYVRWNNKYSENWSMGYVMVAQKTE